MTIKATVRPSTAVQVDDKIMKFSEKNGSFTTKDPGLAREIDARYGNKGGVVPGETVTVPMVKREAGHKYLFSMPEMPWKKAKDA
jgi:hypothetical protein